MKSVDERYADLIERRKKVVDSYDGLVRGSGIIIWLFVAVAVIGFASILWLASQA